MKRPVAAALALAGAVFLPTAIAQQAAPPNALSFPAATLIEQEGVLWGLGHGFKCAFHADGAEFIPVLGAQARQNMPVRFRLESIGRGATRTPMGAPIREHDALQVRYLRPEVTECWDVRDAGVEQSFVFAQLPAGAGELVVDVAMATGLLVAPKGDGLELSLPGIGSCTIGGVTGIDANGERVAGSLRYEDGHLRLSLPAAFVERAALPLVLDPLVGNVVVLASAGALANPDSAYDASSDWYAVAWEVAVSGTDTDIYAQSVTSAGAVMPTVFPVAVGISNDRRPKIAGTASFVVCVFERAGDIMVTDFLTVGGPVPAPVLVAGGANNQVDPDIGSFVEQAAFRTWAMIVWADATTRTVRGRPLSHHVSSGAITLGAEIEIFADAGFARTRPRISETSRTPRHLVVCGGATAGTADPYARFLEVRSGLTAATLGAERNAHANPSLANSVDVDGDGNHWVLAWVNGTADTIEAASVRYYADSVGPQWTGVVTVQSDSVTESAPSLAMTSNSCVLTWVRNTPAVANQSVWAVAIDPFSGLPFDSRVQVTQQFTRQQAPQVVARGFGANRDDALIAFEGITIDGDIAFQRWTSVDGTVDDLGGGCGALAQAYAPCARVGNTGFNLRLDYPYGPVSATLLLSPQVWGIGLPCGACRVVPDPLSGILVTTTVHAVGNHPIAIPAANSLAGTSVVTQWLIPNATDPECAWFAMDFSNALRITLQ